jgi:hypothetical protein
MIHYKLDYLAEVENDLQNMIDWYDQQQYGLGKKFLEYFKSAIIQIQRYPLLHGIRNHNARFRHLDRFPYKIASRIINDRIIVFGVFHDKRNPQLIVKRLK